MVAHTASVARPGTTSAGLLVLRLAAGGFLLPHGLGKLLGWFGGPGIAGFAAELQHFGLPSARRRCPCCSRRCRPSWA